MIARLLKAGKTKIILWTAALVVLATLADWASGNNISLAAIYILPMMLGAVVLRPAETAGLALLCSYLRSFFDIPGSTADLVLRFLFAALAYFISGLFVTALLRNRQQALGHLYHIEMEQSLRREAEEQLRALAESSPAAILTIDGNGDVLAANDAAGKLLLLPDRQTLIGVRIGEYLPVLADALRLDTQIVGLRTATQCQGYRHNGEIFLAHMWFSSYLVEGGKRLAVIVVDSSEEMRDREEQGLRHLHAGNQMAAVAIAHEVRNMCEAMAMLCQDLRRRHDLAGDDALRGLDRLVTGMEKVASLELQPKMNEGIEKVSLREVLDHLRIVVEPAWREIEGTVVWSLPEVVPMVLAEPHGLLQAFLNLAQNSHRAVQDSEDRKLEIGVSQQRSKVMVQFEDSGPGVQAPENLFLPFQKGAIGTGLGLYVSRFLVRTYGGELRFEPRRKGSCFVIELEVTDTAKVARDPS